MGKKIDPAERDRVLYSMLLPAVRLARLLTIPLRSLQDWTQMSYFEEWRRQGKKLREIAELLGISPRKVALLSKRLKQNFSAHEQGMALPRQIEYQLWPGPMSSARIKQVIQNATPEEIDEALERLVEDERVTVVQRERNVVYEVPRSHNRFIAADFGTKLDGLEHFLEIVARTVHLRFFQNAPEAQCRNIDSHIRKKDIKEIEKMYRELIWKRVVELEEIADAEPDRDQVVPISLAVCWSRDDAKKMEGANGD